MDEQKPPLADVYAEIAGLRTVQREMGVEVNRLRRQMEIFTALPRLFSLFCSAFQGVARLTLYANGSGAIYRISDGQCLAEWVSISNAEEAIRSAMK